MIFAYFNFKKTHFNFESSWLFDLFLYKFFLRVHWFLLSALNFNYFPAISVYVNIEQKNKSIT